MPKEIGYRTIIQEVNRVSFEGELHIGEGVNDYHWWVADDDIEPWLDKFEGKRVRLEIRLLDTRDETAMLGEPEPAEPGA